MHLWDKEKPWGLYKYKSIHSIKQFEKIISIQITIHNSKQTKTKQIISNT